MDFLLRPWALSDAKSIWEYADNKKVSDNLRDAFPHPYAFEDAVQFIGGILVAGEERQCCRAIEVEGKAAGSIGVFLKSDVYRKSAEIGYWLAEPYWGHGIMSRAIRELCAYAFTRYDLERIYAEIFAPNTGSRRALEKAGFLFEGTLKNSICKNGRLMDSLVYALLK